jgi:hypothetical protein
MNFHDFELLVFVACIIWLYNHILMGFEVSYAYLESEYSLEVCQSAETLVLQLLKCH